MARKFRRNPNLPQERVNERTDQTQAPQSDAKKNLREQQADAGRSDKPIEKLVGKGRLDRPNPAPPDK